MKTVGDRFWTHGPVVLSPRALHDKWCQEFSEADARRLRRLRKACGVLTIDGQQILFARNEETGVVRWGKAVVLVHAQEESGCLLERDRVAAMASIDPRAIEARAWERVGSIVLPRDAVLFDAQAGHVPDSRKKKIAVGLDGGTYVIEMASGTALAKPYPSKVVAMKYRFIRLRPPDWVQPAVTQAEAVVGDGPVVADDALRAATKGWAQATSDGVPMVIAPRLHLAAWSGIVLDKGPRKGRARRDDYDRACAVNGVGVLPIGGGQGLVVAEPGPTMFWPTAQGGLIVIWLGADSVTGCIAAALSIPERAFKPQRAALAVEKGAEEFVIFDSASAGSTLRKNGRIGDEGERTAAFSLAAGTYAIAACWNWEAQVQVGRRLQDTMVAAVRLTRS